LTAVAENEATGQLTMRLHTGVYIGRTALALERNRPAPPGRPHELRDAADYAWRRYKGRLVDETSRVLGLVWDSQPGPIA
jgi:hypothetical protein